jgi:hypothetical protein
MKLLTVSFQVKQQRYTNNIVSVKICILRIYLKTVLVNVQQYICINALFCVKSGVQGGALNRGLFFADPPPSLLGAVSGKISEIRQAAA